MNAKTPLGDLVNQVPSSAPLPIKKRYLLATAAATAACTLLATYWFFTPANSNHASNPLAQTATDTSPNATTIDAFDRATPSLIGRATSSLSADITVQSAGTLVSKIAEGESFKVTEGAAIFTLANPELVERLKLKQIELAALKSRRITRAKTIDYDILQHQSTMEESRLQWQLASEVTRANQNLHSKNVISDIDMRRYELEEKTAQLQVAFAEKKAAFLTDNKRDLLAELDSDIQTAELEIQGLERKVAELTITAPFSGTFIVADNLSANTGAYLNANTRLGTLHDMRQPEFRVRMSNQDVAAHNAQAHYELVTNSQRLHLQLVRKTQGSEGGTGSLVFTLSDTSNNTQQFLYGDTLKIQLRQ
ncbi:hypothetical protein L1F30_02270 [Simiduia sp. 21SJ11W-1]|uniref:HlyD family secretion protein n=1 Tax=Simiduia sp. 21SJ11W-1 TaxID=2909669 RepID=UPI0020A18213|nr:hypothetical protein [Simiduia sp. 21SJ11W-1]UTA48381.1 hypothetical protein L1F30_02270 [Simiduia sp. 21SJ11W-1]